MLRKLLCRKGFVPRNSRLRRSAAHRFTALFEPLIILIMGIVIGSLILSLLLAITSINDVNI